MFCSTIRSYFQRIDELVDHKALTIQFAAVFLLHNDLPFASPHTHILTRFLFSTSVFKKSSLDIISLQ